MILHLDELQERINQFDPFSATAKQMKMDFNRRLAKPSIISGRFDRTCFVVAKHKN